jgi:hypothetical protein
VKILEICNPQVHHLLEIEPDCLSPSLANAPLWAREALASCAWVVVRRAHASLRDAVELVRLRAEAMMTLYPSGHGLSAIIGLTESQVLKIVQAETSDHSQYSLATLMRHARL